MIPYNYTPNERIVDRAIEIWISLLKDPKYDNLGKNSTEPIESRVQNTMASILVRGLPKNNDDETLKKFGVELKKFLMEETEYEYIGYKDEVVWGKQMFNYLSVDYHPDIPLRIAAEKAGLKMEFPWKTSMFVGEAYVSIANGYGAERVYHYPLTGGKWLVTTLCGEDIIKIINLIETGILDVELNPIKK